VVFRSLCCSYGSGKTHIEQQGNHRNATKLDLSTRTLVYLYKHYNKRGVYCDQNIIANNKEKSFRKPAVANHNFSQTLKLLQNHNICTHTITSSSQLPKLIQSQNFSNYNFFYTPFAIPNTSEIICNKPITAKTYRIDSKLYRFSI
jgi:hypothetical protein